MKKDLILSSALHALFVIVMIVITPFQPHVRTDFGDVIRVQLAAMPVEMQTTPAPAEPITIPQAIDSDEEISVLPDTKSITEAKKIKPKEEPKKKKDTEPKPYQPDKQKGDKDQSGLPEGTKDVSENLGAGSKFGSAAVDNASFDYPYWFYQAFSKIERNWSNPIYSASPLECVIYFQVIRSGRIIRIEIERSSGIDAFDGACERAVKSSKPLPPLPAEFAEEVIGIHLTFPYEPR